MTAIAELLSAVTSRYAALGCPAWPDPWPDREPADEAYSRLTDPGRYEIVFRRADAWLAELAALPGFTVEPLGDLGRWTRGGYPFARGRRVTSDRPGSAALLVLERDDPMPVLLLALEDPEAALEEQPDCGCDACDSGSEDLLSVVDGVFEEILTSPVVLLYSADGRWHARWSHQERQAGGSSDVPRSFEDLMSMCERIAAGEDVALPTGTKVWVSQPWLGGGAADESQGATAQT